VFDIKKSSISAFDYVGWSNIILSSMFTDLVMLVLMEIAMNVLTL